MIYIFTVDSKLEGQNRPCDECGTHVIWLYKFKRRKGHNAKALYCPSCMLRILAHEEVKLGSQK